MLQHHHDSSPFSEKNHHLIVLCDGLQSPANIGAIFRLCDAFGVAELVFNNTIDLASNRLRRTARNTENTVRWSVSENLLATMETFQKEGYRAVALEISENSVPLSNIETEAGKKMVLVVGNERSGVSEQILSRANHVAHIAMYGKNSSMNVAQATAIALYELTKP